MIFFDEMLGASSSPQSYRALAAEVPIFGPAKRKSIVIGDGGSPADGAAFRGRERIRLPAVLWLPERLVFYFGKCLEGVETRMPGRSLGEPMNSTPAASSAD